MLNKLLQKDQFEERYQSKSNDAVDNIQVVQKKKGRKIVLFGLVLVLSAGAGFSGMTLMGTENKGKATSQRAPAVSKPVPLPAAPQKAAALGSVKYDPAPNPAVSRDVFKEFYLRHAAPGAILSKGPAMHLEQDLPNLTRLLNANSGVQALAPVQSLNTALVNEQLREVKIYGITCIGESDFLAGKCAAITSEGVLKEGDKLGSETVFTVNETFFATRKRTVELN